jgi:hypothetical protein
MRHLLPCPCGQSIPIDTSQAGERITCAKCGQSQDAPTYRGIKALPLDAADVAAAKQAQQAAGEWSPTQGYLFALGLVLLLIGLCGAVYCAYVVRQIDVPDPTPEMMAEFDSRIDKVKIDQLFEVFLKFKADGLGLPEPPLHVVAKRVEAAYTRSGIGCGIVAAVGLLLAGSSLVVGSGKKRSASGNAGPYNV